MKFERWGDIPDKTLLVKNEQGLILDPEFEGLSEQEKLQYFDRNSVAIPEARKKMIKQHLTKRQHYPRFLTQPLIIFFSQMKESLS